ncbi:MAG: pirin family protein [Oceanicaulis sp.]|nr:pirin family protein [Oceanicaulis sp.]
MSEIERIIPGRKKELGGFSVARVLPFAKRRRVGPFVFFDEMGPATFAPGHGIDVRPHPHIGLSTVTYLFEGEMDHADTLGVHQTIRPGEVNLMTAGRGITHSERTGPAARKAGQDLHGIQIWIALPDGSEEIEPAFHHHAAAELPEFERGGAMLRLILGTAYEHRSPVKAYSPIVYIHAEAPAGAAIDLPRGHGELAAYVVSGAIEIAGEPVSAGHMAVFAPGEAPVLRVRADSRIMILGGANIGERHIDWNFVSSSKARIEQARADWRASIAGGFKNTPFVLPPGEHEWIPLPGDADTGAPPEQTEDCPTS